MAKELTYNAELIKREDYTPELTVFHFRYDDMPTVAGPSFVPGQYVALGLNNVEVPEKGSVRRSMSIASAPEQTDRYEFFIRWVVAYNICSRVAAGRSVAQAGDEVIKGVLVEAGGSGGVIIMDAAGNIAMPHNTAGMYRASIGTDGALHVAIYGDE